MMHGYVVWRLPPTGDSREGKILRGLGRVYTNPLAVTPEILVFHYTIDFGKKSIVAAEPDISARVDLGTELTHQDIACPNNLARKYFNPAPLTGTIATVP
jgi:hypothetical protein